MPFVPRTTQALRRDIGSAVPPRGLIQLKDVIVNGQVQGRVAPHPDFTVSPDLLPEALVIVSQLLEGTI